MGRGGGGGGGIAQWQEFFFSQPTNKADTFFQSKNSAIICFFGDYPLQDFFPTPFECGTHLDKKLKKKGTTLHTTFYFSSTLHTGFFIVK